MVIVPRTSDAVHPTMPPSVPLLCFAASDGDRVRSVTDRAIPAGAAGTGLAHARIGIVVADRGDYSRTISSDVAAD